MVRIILVTLDRQWSGRISAGLSQVGGFSVVAKADNLMDAYNEIEAQAPDVVLVAQEFTRLAEFEMMLALFKLLKTRWLSVTQSNATQTGRLSMGQSKNAGVFSIDVAEDISSTVAIIRSVTVPMRTAAVDKGANQAPAMPRSSDKIVLLGASTGGVDALSSVLARYPDTCPPTLIVQHTGQNFGKGLVQLLDRLCPAKVVPAQEGLVIKHGMVCIAAGDAKHLGLSGSAPVRARLIPDSMSSLHVPSVDCLFRSAVPFAHKVVAGVLTGMGRDGADALLELRKAGAQTFAQDEASSVVYGMPRAAWTNGAAECQVGLSKIVSHILQHSQITPERAGGTRFGT